MIASQINDMAEERDVKARDIGLIVAIPGTLYTTAISRVSDVYIDFINGQWVGWRETHYTGNPEPAGVKVIAKGNTFDYVLIRVESYLKYIRRNRG